MASSKKCCPAEYVIRQSPRRKRDMHLLAANVDQAVLIATVVEPNLKQGFIDRFLLMTEPSIFPPCSFSTKPTFMMKKPLRFWRLEQQYESIGYEVLLTCVGDRAGHNRTKRIVARQNKPNQWAVGGREKHACEMPLNPISNFARATSPTTPARASTQPLSPRCSAKFGGFIIDRRASKCWHSTT